MIYFVLFPSKSSSHAVIFSQKFLMVLTVCFSHVDLQIHLKLTFVNSHKSDFR